jgi:hypothetical protein
MEEIRARKTSIPVLVRPDTKTAYFGHSYQMTLQLPRDEEDLNETGQLLAAVCRSMKPTGTLKGAFRVCRPSGIWRPDPSSRFYDPDHEFERYCNENEVVMGFLDLANPPVTTSTVVLIHTDENWCLTYNNSLYLLTYT